VDARDEPTAVRFAPATRFATRACGTLLTANGPGVRLTRAFGTPFVLRATRRVASRSTDGVLGAVGAMGVAVAGFILLLALPNLPSIEALIKMMGVEWKMAGTKAVIDGPALKLIRDKRVPTFVVNGRNLPELTKALQGHDFHGTRITFPDAAAAPAKTPGPAATPAPGRH